MTVFSKKVGEAKSAFGSNYMKEGRVWLLMETAKQDKHSNSSVEQAIFETTIINVLDPGPAVGQRWQTSKGGNESPPVAGDPCTLYYGMGQKGAETRVRRLLVVAYGVDESKLPPSVHPLTGQDLQLVPGTPIDPNTCAPVAPGTPGAVVTVNPVEFAMDQATSPTTQTLRNVVIEVIGKPHTTQQKKEKIIASDVMRRVPAREVSASWEKLPEAARAVLTKDNRLQQMLAAEEKERQVTGK